MGNATSLPGRNEVPPLLEAPPPPSFYDDFVNSPVEELHRGFMTSVCQLIIQHALFWQHRRAEAPLQFRQPLELLKFINIHVSENGANQYVLMELLRRLIYFTPKFSHPYLNTQLLAGLDPYSIIGDFIVSSVPSTILGYKDAPVYYLMEEEISKKLRELVGYPEGAGDCIFPPGTAISNAHSILLARYWKYPESRSKGIMHLPKLVIFASQDCHCSLLKAAIFTGIGLDNLVFVLTDSKGKMCITHLINCIQEVKQVGKVPFMVLATSGTNAFGAFDPLEELARVCKTYDMWLHSDAALGAGVIWSETYRKRMLKGIELCDSISGNFHKLGSAGQVSAFLMTPHTSILKDTFGLDWRPEDQSSYQKSENELCFFHSERDAYKKYTDDTRRPDIVKLFMMCKGKGLQGLAANVEDAYELSRFLLLELKKKGKFLPLMDEFESPVVSFYYIPSYLQNVDRKTAEFKERLNMHTSFLLAELIKNGVMLTSTQTLRHSPLFFKISTFNSSLTKNDILYLLDQIDNYGTYLRMPFEVPGAVAMVQSDPDSNFLQKVDPIKVH